MLRSVWYLLCRYILIAIPDRLFIDLVRFIHYIRLGFSYYRLDWKQPKTFNEKLNSLKLRKKYPLGTILADKVAVRDYVHEKVGPDILIPVYGVYEEIDEIEWNSLPNAFVLKANHGSGWNLICLDKQELDKVKAKGIMKKWMKRNAYYLSREWQYRDIPPKIICEELVDNEPNDYKIFCDCGKPKFIQVDHARFSNHQRTIFDLAWKAMNFQYCYENISQPVQKPHCLNEMLNTASRLSEDLLFCRVDLYVINNKIYFGEITLFPEGGQGPFRTYQQDLEFGAHFQMGIS